MDEQNTAATDPALAERSRLFLRHQHMLQDYIRFLVRGAQEADDLFQEVGVRVLASREALVQAAAFPAWCRGIARNLVLHHWRSQRRSKEVPNTRLLEILEVAYAESDLDAETWNQRRVALRTCLERIDERGRDLLTRHYRHGETSEAAGLRLGRSAVAVTKALMTVRKVLQACIERHVPEGQA